MALGCAAMLFGYASLVTVSYSVVLLLITGLLALSVTRTTSSIRRAAYACIVTILVVGVVVGRSFDQVTLIEKMRVAPAIWRRALPDSIADWLVGGGLDAAGGNLLREGTSSVIIDSGWVQVWSMTGLAGLGSMVLFLLIFAGAYHRVASSRLFDRKRKEQTVGATAGAAGLALLVASAHNAVIFRPVVDIVFYALVAITLSTYSNSRVIDGSWVQQTDRSDAQPVLTRRRERHSGERDFE
jgi:hypothetical protein